MYSVFIVKMRLRNFHRKFEFFFAKCVIVAHKTLKHLTPVIYLFLIILEATGYGRHNNAVQNTKIQFST